MMDSAYFVGRKELLDFFNELLDLNLSKIEETASGGIACQLTDLIFPGSIQLSRINWGA
jgi:microtubule-associated protein, RP/EB family